MSSDTEAEDMIPLYDGMHPEDRGPMSAMRLTCCVLADRETFYISDPVTGYTDCKFLDQIKAGAVTRTHYSGTKIFA